MKHRNLVEEFFERAGGRQKGGFRSRSIPEPRTDEEWFLAQDGTHNVVFCTEGRDSQVCDRLVERGILKDKTRWNGFCWIYDMTDEGRALHTLMKI